MSRAYTPEWLPQAQKLRAEGMSYGEIARRLGVSKSVVLKRLNPELAREWRRRDAARPERIVAKRAWSDANRQRCTDCGGPTGSARGRVKRCRGCEIARRNRLTAERGHQIERWWAEGLTLAQIGERLGWTTVHVAVEINTLRKKGFDLPNRRPYYGGGAKRKVPA